MAVFVVPDDFETIQEAVDAAAVSADVENFIDLARRRIVTRERIVLEDDFDEDRTLTIRPLQHPTRGLDRAAIISVDIAAEPIIVGSLAGHVTLQDLDIVRNVTNRQHLVRLGVCHDFSIERCRIGSIWPGPGAEHCHVLNIDRPKDVLVRNGIFFALWPGTFDCGIWVELGSGEACSLLLYNNLVADHKIYGIYASGPQGDAYLLARNNVVANHPAIHPEPTAYVSHVHELMAVYTSHNAAFATDDGVVEDVWIDCQTIAGTGGFLRRLRAHIDAAFVQHTWIRDHGWHPNPDFFRLIRGGALHSELSDAGRNVENGDPDAWDVAVTDDIERDPRPAGIPLHTDRGPDQIAEDDSFVDLEPIDLPAPGPPRP